MKQPQVKASKVYNAVFWAFAIATVASWLWALYSLVKWIINLII